MDAVKNKVRLQAVIFGAVLGFSCVFAPLSEALATPKSNASSSNLVVFVPGFMAPTELWEMKAIRDYFADRGYEYRVVKSFSGDSIEARADHLYEEINRLAPAGRFHMVAHSMGGLDSRLAIKKYDLGSRVISLTTVSTPHRGSGVADFVDKVACKVEKKDCDNRERGIPEELLKYLTAIRNMTSRFLNVEFNPKVPNDPRVKYFSLGFYMENALKSPIPLYWWGHKLISDQDGNNDGMVSARSAEWGESLGTIESDHIAETVPSLYGGRFIYREVFAKILDRLDNL